MEVFLITILISLPVLAVVGLIVVMSRINERGENDSADN